MTLTTCFLLWALLQNEPAGPLVDRLIHRMREGLDARREAMLELARLCSVRRDIAEVVADRARREEDIRVRIRLEWILESPAFNPVREFEKVERIESASVAGERIVSRFRGGVLCWSISDGEEQWSIPLDSNTVHAPPALAGNFVLVSSRGFGMAAYDLTSGSRVWTVAAPYTGEAPVIAGQIWVQTSPELAGYCVRTGKQLWRGSRGITAIAALPETLAVADSNGDVAGLDPATGHYRWTAKVPIFTSHLTAAGGRFFAAGQARLFCLDSDGKVLWHLDSAPIMNDCVSAGESLVFAVQADHTLLALDVKTGNILWRVKRPSDVLTEWGRRPALQVGALAFVRTPDAKIHIVRAFDGAPIQGCSPFTGELIGVSDVMVVVSAGSTLRIYRVR